MSLRLYIPSKITPGDTVIWRDSNLRGADPLTGKLGDYLPSTHKILWSLRGASSLDAESIADGNDFLTTITQLQSSGLVAGTYFWQAYIQNLPTEEAPAIARLTIGMGQLEVVPGLSFVSAPHDGRSDTQQMLDAINEAIKARASGGAVQEYSIKGRSLKYAPITELIALRNQLKMEVSREKAASSIAQGLGDPRRLFVRWR